MAIARFIGNAIAVAQVNTITPANVASTNTFTVTINGKSITVTAGGGDTVATICAALTAALSTSAAPEFLEVTWVNNTTNVTGTSNTAGKPFTQTSSASGGTASLTTATPTASSGPKDLSITANYAAGALPSSGDTLNIESLSSDILYGLSALASITLAAVNIAASFTGKIGLPVFTATSGGYAEYRPQYMQLAGNGASFAVNVGNGSGNGSGRIKIDCQTYQTTLNAYGMASATDTPNPALLFKGTHASNVVNVNKGTVGVAYLSGEVSTVSNWNVGYITQQTSDSTLVLGSGCTLTTGTQSGGTVTTYATMTTITKMAGQLNVLGTAAVTALNNDAGGVNWQSSGTCTTYVGGPGTPLNLSQDVRAKTFTNCTIYAGASITDPDRRCTFTNGIILALCGVSDVTLKLGSNLTLAITDN